MKLNFPKIQELCDGTLDDPPFAFEPGSSGLRLTSFWVEGIFPRRRAMVSVLLERGSPGGKWFQFSG